MGEAAVPSNSSYDPEVHLSAEDVKVDNRENPSFVEVRIKASKTDVFWKGVIIRIFGSNRSQHMSCSGNPQLHGAIQSDDKRNAKAILLL